MNDLERFIEVPLGYVNTIAWFGFSADPPTLAHRAVIDAVLRTGIVDKLIVFPSGVLPYKEFECTDQQRREMIDLWNRSSEFTDHIVISYFDISSEKAITWYDLWKKIHLLAPKTQHFFIIGSDQYLKITDSWYQGAKLKELARFLVVPREGYFLKLLDDNDFLLEIPPLSGSSTSSRSGDLSGLDELVKAYILDHKLYS